MEPENDDYQKASPFPGVHFEMQNVSFSGVYPSAFSFNEDFLTKNLEFANHISNRFWLMNHIILFGC